MKAWHVVVVAEFVGKRRALMMHFTESLIACLLIAQENTFEEQGLVKTGAQV